MTHPQEHNSADSVFAALVILSLWVFTYAGIFGAVNSSDAIRRAHSCRQNMGFSMLIAAFPPTWIIAPFATGFYEGGFKLTCKD